MRHITEILPAAKSDIFPLWREKNDKPGKYSKKPYKWTKRDFSKTDWAAEFMDYENEGDDLYNRHIPEHYAVRGGKYIMIDIDAKGVPGKAERIRQQLENIGLNTKTFTVRTKSDGLHLYYLSPGHFVTSSTKHFTKTYGIENVDIRGQGGNVTGPHMDAKEWKEGVYFITNPMMPIKCSIELPDNKKKRLPTIDAMGGNVISILSNKTPERVALGGRDEFLLALSWKNVMAGISKKQAEEEFNKIEFESVPGDEIVFEMLWEKMERDQENQLLPLDIALSRFVFIQSSQTIADLATGADISGPLKKSYPAKIWVREEGKTKSVNADIYWTEHPDRLEAWDYGYKPVNDALIMDNGRVWINTYRKSEIEPWPEATDWDDPYFKEYRAIIENLCNGNERSIEMLMSARAAKVQDLEWTPRWGFVFISDHKQVGKDLQLKLFIPLIVAKGSGYNLAVSKADLEDGRQLHMRNNMVVLINETQGMKSAAAKEGVKIMFSEENIFIKKMGKGRSAAQRTYRIPEIHSNVGDVVEMKMGNKRFAPIITRGEALDYSVYNNLQKKENVPGDEFLRKLKRLFMDWPIHKDIRASGPPRMPDDNIAEEMTKEEGVASYEQALEEENILLKSDVQTEQSIKVALEEYCVSAHGVNGLYSMLLKTGYFKKVTRCNNIPLIEYKADPSMSDINERDRIHKVAASRQRAYVLIRNADYHIEKARKHHGSISEYYLNHFFNLDEWAKEEIENFKKIKRENR